MSTDENQPPRTRKILSLPKSVQAAETKIAAHNVTGCTDREKAHRIALNKIFHQSPTYNESDKSEEARIAAARIKAGNHSDYTDYGRVQREAFLLLNGASPGVRIDGGYIKGGYISQDKEPVLAFKTDKKPVPQKVISKSKQDVKPTPVIKKTRKLPDRVWPNQIEAILERIEFRFDIIETCVFCHSFIDNKFHVESDVYATVSPGVFNAEQGKEKALERCKEKTVKALWKMEGYKLYLRTANTKPNVTKPQQD